jgi:phospholipid-translocating ATPase
MSSEPVMMNPDFDKEFILQADASTFGMGALLSQLNDEGKERAISDYSRKLLSREAKICNS